ncbi:glutamic acid-rich protein [Trifolium repens]|nr:glutamic acid-rich protein [Trifolium repens]
MFLICNGILAFLAKNLLFIPTTSSEAHFDQLHASSDDMIVAPFASYQSLEEVSLLDEEQEDEYYEEKVLEAEEHNEACIGKEKEVNVLAQDEYEDEVEETTLTTNEELVNTEELNRKFEEFIRKMKEEMRIEAQTHLIAV